MFTGLSTNVHRDIVKTLGDSGVFSLRCYWHVLTTNLLSNAVTLFSLTPVWVSFTFTAGTFMDVFVTIQGNLLSDGQGNVGVNWQVLGCLQVRCSTFIPTKIKRVRCLQAYQLMSFVLPSESFCGMIKTNIVTCFVQTTMLFWNK